VDLKEPNVEPADEHLSPHLRENLEKVPEKIAFTLGVRDFLVLSTLSPY
jgi:hypothetical protein